jgi:hypothetical protein
MHHYPLIFITEGRVAPEGGARSQDKRVSQVSNARPGAPKVYGLEWIAGAPRKA